MENKPQIGSKWRHYKNAATYTVIAVTDKQQADEFEEWIVRPEFYRYANDAAVLVRLRRTPLGVSYVCTTSFDCPMVFYRGESGQWCRTLYNFCGFGDNEEKRFIEVEK